MASVITENVVEEACLDINFLMFSSVFSCISMSVTRSVTRGAFNNF